MGHLGGDMRYLVAVPLDDGNPFLIEVDEISSSTVVRSARPGEVAATVTTSFGAALAQLQPMAHTIIARFRDLPEKPDGISVEFGLKMTMEAGLVVAHSSGEANFRVSLQWNKK